MKTIVFRHPNGSTESHDHSTLGEVLNKVGSQSGTLILERWDRKEIGYQYVSEAVIGNINNGLGVCQEDYYRAYDQIF